MDSHRQRQITFGVIATYYILPSDSQYIFVSLRISLDRLRITFTNGFAKKTSCFGLHPFFGEVLCNKEQQCE